MGELKQTRIKREVIAIRDDLQVFALFRAAFYPSEEHDAAKYYVLPVQNGDIMLVCHAGHRFTPAQILTLKLLVWRYGDAINKSTYCEVDLRNPLETCITLTDMALARTAANRMRTKG
jgi:hypothetical protein